MCNINIELLNPIAEAMSKTLQTGVSISRHYDPAEKPMATFMVGGGKAFNIVQELSDKEEVEQKFTFCCYLVSLMRNSEAEPQQFYKGAIEHLTGQEWDEDEDFGFGTIHLIKVFHMLLILTSYLEERSDTELIYWQEANRRRPMITDRTRVAHLRDVVKLKFDPIGVFEMAPADEVSALEALSKCLDNVLIQIENDWEDLARKAKAKDMTPAQIYEHNRAIAQEHKRFQEKAREHMGPEDEENRVLDTF